jgi:hypothetical protein
MPIESVRIVQQRKPYVFDSTLLGITLMPSFGAASVTLDFPYAAKDKLSQIPDAGDLGIFNSLKSYLAPVLRRNGITKLHVQKAPEPATSSLPPNEKFAVQEHAMASAR